MPNDCLRMKGFHGTLMNNAIKIKNGGFLPSTKEIEWLGEGIYFFEKFTNAHYWACKQKENLHSVDFPAVVCAELSVMRNDFLDLDVPSIMREFEKYMVQVMQSMEGGAPQFDNEYELRCFCCNYYVCEHSNIKMLAYSFPRETNPIQKNRVGFPFVLSNRQYCVVDQICVEKIYIKRLEAI